MPRQVQRIARYRRGVYRFLLSRRWLGLLAAAVAVAVGCVLMGLWQLDRLQERHARNDLLTRNLAAAPAPVDRLLAVGRGPAPDQEYRRVRAVGRYDPGAQLLVRLRPFEGRVGYYVLTPLVTDPGPALLVNRGWLPDPGSAATPAVPAPPAGPVTVVARVRPSEPASTTGTPPPGQVSRIHVPSIAADLPYEVYGGYADLAAQRPATTPAPRLLPQPEPSEGPHLAYAFQWFVFAALALGGYVVLARREAADRRAGPPPARPAAARVVGPRAG